MSFIYIVLFASLAATSHQDSHLSRYTVLQQESTGVTNHINDGSVPFRWTNKLWQCSSLDTFTADFLTWHSRKSTGVTNNINNGDWFYSNVPANHDGVDDRLLNRLLKLWDFRRSW